MAPETITAAASGTWTLGDLTVYRLGFGAMRLPQTGRVFSLDARPRDRDQAIAVLRKAVELGINHIDTAAFYFSRLRSANELINTALAPYPDDLVITTKVGPGRDASGEWTDKARPDQLRGQVEENLRQLGRDHMDVVNYRRQASTDSIAEHFGALAELQQAGLVRHLGISGVEVRHLHEALAIAPVVCVQNSFGIGSPPEALELLAECGRLGVAFVPFFAIARGHGDMSEVSQSTQVQAIAAALGASEAQIRLAWTLGHGGHVLAIPGTGDLNHLAENVAAGSLRLSAAELAMLQPSA
jgi:pyridoxine 4-dehydrogenase